MILGEEQQNALELMKVFIDISDNTAFSLTGAAGTGKSTIVNCLCDYLDKEGIPYVLCAPTHKAALILRKFTERETMTLHRLLALSPNIDILDLDFKDLLFKTDRKPLEFPFKGVVICDEASMINDDLFDLLIQRSEEYCSKIVFVSDKCQLSPVKSRVVSKVYNLPSSYNLTKIYRQSSESALVDTLQTLRQFPVDRLESSFSSDGNLVCTSKMNEFLNAAKISFKKAISRSDIFEAKILAFTNERVELHNRNIRRVLWNDNKPFHKFEFLTGYDNITYEENQFYNSMDYVISTEPEMVDIYIPRFGQLPGYRFELYDSFYDASFPISVLDPYSIDTYTINSLAEEIEKLRLSAVSYKDTDRRKWSFLWKEYFKMINSFTCFYDLMYNNRVIRRKSFDYGYALTTHKSQGSTISNAFIDLRDINRCQDNEMKRQLQYVALSRTSKNAVVYQ